MVFNSIRTHSPLLPIVQLAFEGDGAELDNLRHLSSNLR